MRVGERVSVEAAPRARRTAAAVVAAVAVVAVLAPMFRSPAPDGFPLSTYPMFARDRGAETWVDTIVGRDGDGVVLRLSPEAISGSDEPVLASESVTQALGAGTPARLCARAADRVAAGGRAGIVALEVVSELHDLDRFDPDEPLERRVHARCEVP